MPQGTTDPRELETRRRVRQQLQNMQRASGGEESFAWDTDDEADHELLFVPDRLLVDKKDKAEFDDIIAARAADFPGGVAPVEIDRGDDAIEEVYTYQLPAERL